MTGAGVRWAALPAARAAPLADEPDDGPVRTTLLGDTVIAWTSDGEAASRIGRLGAAPATASALMLVTQVGRTFQDEHAARVLVEHGRHLVVDAGSIAGPGETCCWRVEPLPAGVVVRRVAPARGPADPVALELIAALSPAAAHADITWLAGRGSRHSLSPGFAEAAGWCADRLHGLGYAVSRQTVTVGAGQSENVVADRIGRGAGTRGVVVVTAHLDSINLPGGPAAPAPGADDNGSGSAGVLELARLLALRAWEHDVRLILFGGEEQGLHGSLQYVAALPAGERARIRAVLNMDMIATRNTVQPAVLLEGATVSASLVDDLAAAAATYTGLRVETSLSPFASDHVPFIDAGVPAVLTIEGADQANGNIHTANDTVAHIDSALMGEILKMNVGALVGWLGAVSPVPVPVGAGPVVARGPGRLDVFVVGTDSALHHKAWDGTAWRPGVTAFEDLGRP